MLEFKAEGLCRNADGLNESALRRAMAGREILQSAALAFDTQRRLHFSLNGQPALMAYEDCAEGVVCQTMPIPSDMSILPQVGGPVK